MTLQFLKKKFFASRRKKVLIIDDFLALVKQLKGFAKR